LDSTTHVGRYEMSPHGKIYIIAILTLGNVFPVIYLNFIS